jgi:Resolvase, N terminal domain
MTRREFITLFGGATALPGGVYAQQTTMPVIGWLESGSRQTTADYLPAFRKGLAESGYVEGRNVATHGRLMLTVLGGLAEFERELIWERTEEGRKRAMDRGVKFGRPRKMTPHQHEEALERLRAGDSQADVARTYGVDPAVICRLAKLAAPAAPAR